jgi:hypothetical protein
MPSLPFGPIVGGAAFDERPSQLIPDVNSTTPEPPVPGVPELPARPPLPVPELPLRPPFPVPPPPPVPELPEYKQSLAQRLNAHAW